MQGAPWEGEEWDLRFSVSSFQLSSFQFPPFILPSLMDTHGEVVRLTNALLREYLARRGFTETLQSFDREQPRDESTISSRRLLAQGLCLEKLLRRNRSSAHPFDSMIEVIVNYLYQRAQAQAPSPTALLPSSSPPPCDAKTLPCDPSQHMNKSTGRSPRENGGGVSSATQKLAPLQRVPTPVSNQRGRGWVLEDVEGEEGGLGDLPVIVPPPIRQDPAERGCPVDARTAKTLQELVLGRDKGTFADRGEGWWQGFVFSSVPGLEYGLVQWKGGPCGVLAAVQAFILYDLFFKDPSWQARDSVISVERVTDALFTSLTSILWQAKSGEGVTVVLPSSNVPVQRGDITRRLTQYSMKTSEETKHFLSRHSHLFQKRDGCGVLLFLFSVMLSRGPVNLVEDMDDRTATLMATFGYCTQELVNLLLTGAAHSNPFDGQMQLDKGIILRGIQRRSTIGYLSLLEKYKYTTVGDWYKNPLVPIWVVSSESHFTVLFSTRSLNTRTLFDLYYYDGLANQDAIIRLTIDISQSTSPPCDLDTTPPLELVIQTKWPHARVNWNNTEPLL